MRDGSGTARVAREDAVLATVSLVVVVGRGGGEVPASEGAHVHRTAAVAPVEPDLVAAILNVEEVADGQILDRDAVDLERLDPVSADGIPVRIQWPEVLRHGRGVARRGAGLRAIDDHGITVEAAKVDVPGGMAVHRGARETS